MELTGDAAVFSVDGHPSQQALLLNNDCAMTGEAESGAGVGGAVRRMNTAKLVVSESGLPVSETLGGTGVLSSGVSLNTQPGTAARSLENNSLETPCSTL